MKTELIVLDGGQMKCTDLGMLDKGNSDGGIIPLANPVFLIKHKNGIILWDSGLNDSLAREPEGRTNWIFELHLKRTLQSQLKDIGLGPEDITYLALSHSHIDHTGNAGLFAASTIIMQKEEYDFAFESTELPPHYDDYKALKTSTMLKLEGDYDLFGDGTVQFISTPGHTPGHQSLLVNLEQSGPIFISGDIAYFQEQYDNRGVPVFNSDAEQSLKSLRKVDTLLKETGAKLWIQHDSEQFKTLQLAPNSYN